MAFVRCYTGTDGQSHFEDLDLLPSAMERSIEQAASSITFTRSPNGRFSDWHNAPRRQYAIFLSGGQMEVVIGDGTTRRFGPGDTILFEDLTGQGRTSRSVGGGPPDRYRALSGLASSRWSCTRRRRIMISSRKRVAHTRWKRLIGQGVYHTSKGPTVGRAKGRGRGQQPSRKLEGEKHG